MPGDCNIYVFSSCKCLTQKKKKEKRKKDTLSRFYLNDIKPEFDENNLIRHVRFTLSNLPISQSRLEQFLLQTKSDCYTINGWPEKHQIPRESVLKIP